MNRDPSAMKYVLPLVVSAISTLAIAQDAHAGYYLGSRAFCSNGFVNVSGYCVDTKGDVYYPLGRTAFCMGGFYPKAGYCIRNGYTMK